MKTFCQVSAARTVQTYSKLVDSQNAEQWVSSQKKGFDTAENEASEVFEELKNLGGES